VRLIAAPVALVAALVAVAPAVAKEGVKATLTTPIPRDAVPGTPLKVQWTLAYVEDGKRHLFGAGGVFVRLQSASGAEPETGYSSQTNGEFAAMVIVPEGGIGDVEIGLMSWRSDATGTHRGDMLFPITNDPLPGRLHLASAGDDDGPSATLIAVVAGALVALTALAALLARRRYASVA
jgi:hypothetical protein